MFNRLPEYVIINKERYYINTDYRLFVDLEKRMQDNEAKEVIINALSKFYPAFFKIVKKGLLKEAIDKFIWFYLCGESINDVKETKTQKKVQERIYDYGIDAQLIWGAYWDRGIDLSVDKLHWWKFKALWKSMNSECQLIKVMGYRCYNGEDKDMLELKEMYKLPPTKFETNERKRQENIYNQLKQISSH